MKKTVRILIFSSAISVIFSAIGYTQSTSSQATADKSPSASKVTNTSGADATSSSGSVMPQKPKAFTGIAKPAPGEKRFKPGSVEKPTKPIPGTAVHLVLPSAWYPGAPRTKISGPINFTPAFEVPENQSGGKLQRI
ncbi:MAG: hypothetical protein ACRC2T_08080, partial [Thermoguttaceae bacterium]